MRVAIRRYRAPFAAIVALLALATYTGGYIVHHQRLRLPFIDETPFRLDAELIDAKAVTPGQGQTVRVAGVRIGDITGVHLEDGHAVVTMEVDQRYRRLIHTDATILLRPKTGFDDMFLDLDPGTPSAPVVRPGFTIPIRNTLPYVNFDEVLSALDSDTRDYLKLLLGDGSRGLRGRGDDLRDLFRRFGPTHRDLARFTAAVAARRHALRRLVHSLDRLTEALAQRAPDVTRLVTASSATLHAVAGEDASLGRAVGDLPAALRQTTDTLRRLRPYADVLGPAARRLRPAVGALDRANRALVPFAREVAPILRDRIRPFVRAARPVVADLRPAASALATATPDLTGSFRVLNRLLDMAAYNPGGRQPPAARDRLEGFLFWIAWLGHESASLYGSADAHGSLRPLLLGGDCRTLEALVSRQPQLEYLLDLTPTLTSPAACGVDTAKLPPLPALSDVEAGRR